MRMKWYAFTLTVILSCLFSSASAFTATVQYTYDNLNRLIQAEYSDGNVIEYTHDATGNRQTRVLTAGVDTDNDGLSDAIENSVPCLDANNADTDNDGIPDGMEDFNHNGVVDIDETNPCSLDTDGDGIQDGTEQGYTLSNIGLDTDTNVFQPDLDNTTITDPLNPDTDGDGMEDGEEDANHNGRVDQGETDPRKGKSKAMPWIPLLLLDD